MTENEHIEEMAAVIEMGRMMSASSNLIAETLFTDNGYRKIPDNIGEFSDGYHTFNELYHHRAVLFSMICNIFPEKSWKSKLHDTGDMFEGMFIVGIETEQGQATYHYDIDPYWNMFKVKELEKAPKWDGHTSTDAIQRIGNISTKGYRKVKLGEWRLIGNANGGFCGGVLYYRCTCCGYEITQARIGEANFCEWCGADMRGEENER